MSVGHMKTRRAVLVEYRVRILGPGQYPPNEVMDEALRVVEASMEYRNNLQRVISQRFVDGIDSLEEAGFTVEVVPVTE